MAGRHDATLIRKDFLRVFALINIRIRFADAVIRRRVDAPRKGGIDAQKAALFVLKINQIEAMLHQRAQQIALMRQRVFHLFMLGEINHRHERARPTLLAAGGKRNFEPHREQLAAQRAVGGFIGKRRCPVRRQKNRFGERALSVVRQYLGKPREQFFPVVRLIKRNGRLIERMNANVAEHRVRVVRMGVEIGAQIVNPLLAQPVKFGFNDGEIIFPERHRRIFEQRAIPGFAFPQEFLRDSALRQIARNRDEAGRLTSLVAQDARRNFCRVAFARFLDHRIFGMLHCARLQHVADIFSRVRRVFGNGQIVPVFAQQFGFEITIIQF